jgi:hypothetical protein
MGLKVDTIQNPSSATVNLTLDTSGNVSVGNNMTVAGTTTLTGAVASGAITSTGLVTGATGALYPVVQGTAQASTSGTAINFTSVIPSWVKRVTVGLNGVSVSGTNNITIQLGTGGSATTTGYVAQTTGIASSVGNTVSSTVGVPIWTNLAVYVWSGIVTFQLVSGNIWVASGVCGNTSTTPLSSMSSGTVTLAGALDTIRIISSATGAPSDSFDAGSINIQWE